MKKLADWLYYTVVFVSALALILMSVVVMTGPKSVQRAIENEIVSPYGNCCFCESYPALEEGGLCSGCEERFKRHAKEDSRRR